MVIGHLILSESRKGSVEYTQFTAFTVRRGFSFSSKKRRLKSQTGLHIFQKLDSIEKENLKEIFSKEIRDKDDFEKTISLIKKYKIIEECYQKAQHYINLASNALTVFEESKDKNIKWPKQPDWYKKPSDINNLFEAMCVNNINENIAEKIIGRNWLNFMKNHF